MMYCYDGPYNSAQEVDRRWVAQAPPGRERSLQWSNKRKKYVRVKKVKK